MLVWVVDIMWKPLLFYKLDLLYNDNLIKCESSDLKNKNSFILIGCSIKNIILIITIFYF